MDTFQGHVDVVDEILSRASQNGGVAAVEDGAATYSYEQLCEDAWKVAGMIAKTASTPFPRVLLVLPRSYTAYVGMIGSLLAGGTFCPVNLKNPDARNTEICLAFRPNIVLHNGNPPQFLQSLPPTPFVDVTQLDTLGTKTAAPERSPTAYVIFTSGSTGRPKGVKVGRSAFSYFLHVAKEYFKLRDGERWGQFSNLGYDLGVMDVFMVLTQGGTLVPLSEAECMRPGSAIRNKRISVWQSVPNIIDIIRRSDQFSSSYLESLRLISFCGEPLLPQQLEALFKVLPDLVVFNTYGATETVGFNTLNLLTAKNYQDSCKGGSVSIGDDVPGWKLHLKNGDAPDEGELVVESEHLSDGYWEDGPLTNSAFRTVDFGDGQIRRVYFTGDRGYRRDLRLYCAGRLDRQVKILGERIELDEIDTFLRRAGFPDTYTIEKDEALYSFVESSEQTDQAKIRSYLQSVLPVHAIPKVIYSMPKLPRNSNGKIDREALRQLVTS